MPGRPAHRALLLLALLGSSGVGCARSGDGAVEACLERELAEEFAAAAATCDAAFAATGTPAAGSAAARAHFNLAYRAWQATEYLMALEHSAAALESAGAAGDGQMVSLATQGFLAVLSAVGDLDGAERTLARAVDLAPAGDAATRAQLLAHRGNLLLDRGLHGLARGALEEALATAPRALDNPQFYRSAHLNLVRVALDLGDLASAERHLEAARGYAPPGGEPVALRYYRALVDRHAGRPAPAVERLTAALQLDPAPDWRWVLEDELGRAHQAAGEPALAAAAWARAIETLEQMRRELALDDLKAWLIERKRRPYEALFRYQVEYGEPLAALATAERAKARSFLDAFVRAARTRAPGNTPPPPGDAARRLASLRGLLPSLGASPGVEPRPAAALVEAVGRHTVWLYFTAEDEIWLLALTRGRVTPRRLGEREVIERLVERTVAAPDEPTGWTALGAALVPPDLLPPAGAPLWIVPDGALTRLPFAALRVAQEPLVLRHPLAYLPSTQAFVGAHHPPAGTTVVLGDPTGDLPAARGEAEQVAAFLGVAPRLGTAADRAALHGAATAGVLHVAAHTGAGAEGPWLALADGRVSAADVLAAPLAPRLTVLATCAAAEGPSRDLWGSLAAAFFAAGSRAVLASAWSVDDASARRWVTSFYAEGGAQAPADAVALAQRAAFAGGRPTSAWAPWMVLGAVPGSFPEGESKATALPTPSPRGGI